MILTASKIEFVPMILQQKPSSPLTAYKCGLACLRGGPISPSLYHLGRTRVPTRALTVPHWLNKKQHEPLYTVRGVWYDQSQLNNTIKGWVSQISIVINVLRYGSTLCVKAHVKMRVIYIFNLLSRTSQFCKDRLGLQYLISIHLCVPYICNIEADRY